MFFYIRNLVALQQSLSLEDKINVFLFPQRLRNNSSGECTFATLWSRGPNGVKIGHLILVKNLVTDLEKMWSLIMKKYSL